MTRKTYSNPLPWDLAEAWFGEEVIGSFTTKPSTLGTWKDRGVPADVALPLILAKFGPRQSDGKVHDLTPGYTEDAADRIAIDLRRRPEDLEWVRYLLRILRDGGETRAEAIRAMIASFHGEVERERPARRSRLGD
jgi:hypothetical protein